MNFDVKPGRGSERVKAWIYTILNPVIDSLRREAELLKVGNLSWRVHSRRCEYIRPISEVIEVNQQPNLEDFLTEYSTFSDRFSEHDSALAAVEHATTEYVLGLLKASDFQEQVRECLKNYEAILPFNPTYPDLHTLPGKVDEYVAEFIANNSRSLPRHYTLYHFWKEYAETFQGYFDGFTETTHYNVRGKTRELLDISKRIRIDLETLRHTLVSEYDIPAAPIVPPGRTPSEAVSPRLRG
jgi:hypothetical protein